jgi:sarcosine oxidase subunit gamma
MTRSGAALVFAVLASARPWAAQHHPRRVTHRRASFIVRVVDTFESIAGRLSNQNVKRISEGPWGPSRIITEKLGLRPPMEPNPTASEGPLTIFSIAPETWLAVRTAADVRDLATRLEQLLSANIATVVDSGAGRRALRLAGSKSRDVLAKLLPLDLAPSRFPVGACAQSVMAHTGVLVHAVAADAFDIFVSRSFAQYLAEVIVDASLEFGIQR